MKTKTLHMQRKIRFPKKLKIAVGALALFCASENTFGQSVGINTNNPDPSASLEVAGTNKGLLIPRISLQSLTDKATIPNPATSLLIYNTNAGVGKKGFYYNSGTPGNPVWSNLGGLTFPSYNSPDVPGGPHSILRICRNRQMQSVSSRQRIMELGCMDLLHLEKELWAILSKTA